MVPLEVQQLFPRWVVILNMSIMRSNSALKNASKCHHGEHVVISKQDINKGVIKMSKTVKVMYDSDTLKTSITVDGEKFDTSRIDGREIEDWAYPFMMRKVRWNGFYDEMVEALNGEKEFNLVFEGSDNALAELKESWEDAPVIIISNGNGENTVLIDYDEDNLKTSITINGQAFDTTRIDGREIADWVYPFMIRKVKWNGIFEELSSAIGSEEYTIQFSGSNSAMMELMEECPENVAITKNKDSQNKKKSNMAIKVNEENNNIYVDDNCEFSNYSPKELVSILSNSSVGYSYTDKEMEQAYKRLVYLAKEQNNANAWFYLGISNWHYSSGKLEFDEECEFNKQCFEKAAELGDARGYRYLSYIAERQGDKIESRRLLRKALKFGDGKAYKEVHYHKEIEFRAMVSFWAEEYDEAIERYNESIEFLKFDLKYVSEDMSAEEIDWFNFYISKNYEEIANCYSELEDEKNKFKSLKSAVEYDEENYFAQDWLGLCYLCGIGTNANPEKAAHCFYKSAEQDYPDAYYHLGVYYEISIGDIDKAREIYEAGAELGSEECEERFSEMDYNPYDDYNDFTDDLKNNTFFTKDNLKKGLKAGAKALGVVGSVTGNKLLAGIANGAESLISSILDEDDL